MHYRFFVALLLLVTAGVPSAADVIWVPAPQIDASFEKDASGDRIVARGYSSTTSPGDPALPSREIRVILPPDADPASLSVRVRGARVVVLSQTWDIAPAPPMATSDELDPGAREPVLDWRGPKQIEGGRNVETYRRDAFSPGSHVELIHAGHLGRWLIATVRFRPYLYNPVTRRLRLSSGGRIDISYSRASATAGLDAATPMLSDDLARIAVNYDEAREWYEGRQPTTASPQAVTGYAIITTSAIVQGSSKLQAFVNHKTSRGFTVSVVTETQWGGGTGDAAANKIRAWLKANYASKSLKYVLMIGNPHPSTGTVPMKMLWPRYESSTYREAPSDYFYADLTGNWDRNGDGYYGALGDFGVGGIDLLPEVIVGRIPFYGSYADLDSILGKTIDYESGGIGGPWVRNVLVTMKPSDANTPGYHLGEAIKNDAANPAGFSMIRVYDQTYGLSPAPDYTPCSYSTCTAAAQRRAGFWFWWTHGNETIADQIMTTSRTADLDDHYPAFVFQCSCLNGTPERADNLGCAMLKRGAIATVSASRVSWYYQGQVDYSATDSGPGMTYRYAQKLVRDHMRCGDAFYSMMLQVPQEIWMNHVVFNVYGDPSVAYAAGPLITHSPLQDTDDYLQPYQVRADVTSNGPLAAQSPVVHWSVNGGASFSTSAMGSIGGVTYAGSIPAQPLGATVHYYIHALDSQSRAGSSPTSAPTELHSFRVKPDSQPPAISHIPLTDTGITAGPYEAKAAVTDDCGVRAVVLSYRVNGGAESQRPMISQDQTDTYAASIQGPLQQGDRVEYCITATDTSIAAKTARTPATGYHSFRIRTNRVAVYNCTTVPSYFVGSNSNIYSGVMDALSQDPKQRFSPVAVTSLSPADLADKDALVLPDNGVATADLASVQSWFATGKVIVAIDSSASYAAYSGLLWPSAAGTSGFGVCWDANASVDDQRIAAQDPITVDYSLGQIIKSRGYGVQFYTSALPADAQVLAVSNNNPARSYAVYRDVPGAGRIVALGPYRPLESQQHSILREALMAPAAAPRSVQFIYPSDGAGIDAGATVQIRYSVSGSWSPSDAIKLEYNTGLDSIWHAVPGAASLPYDGGSCFWSTVGQPASLNFRLRASLVGGAVVGESGTFAIAPVMTVPSARNAQDGSVVKLAGVIVTSAMPGASYVQETSRTAGIRVSCSDALTLGASVALTGVVSTVDGERVLVANTVEQVAGISGEIRPIAMSTSALGGGPSGRQQAVQEYQIVRIGQTNSRELLHASGASNVGILVRLAGRVTATGDGCFYLDDGARCDDGSGLAGVRVVCPATAVPAIGQVVTLTGVSSTYFERGCLWRAVVMPEPGYLSSLVP